MAKDNIYKKITRYVVSIVGILMITGMTLMVGYILFDESLGIVVGITLAAIAVILSLTKLLIWAFDVDNEGKNGKA